MTLLGKSSRLLVAWFLVAGAPAAAAFKYLDVGQEAPDFALESVAGGTVQLKENLGAKALAIVFWAAWSPRSKAVLDDLERLYQKRKAQGLEILAVNVEHEDIGAEDRKMVATMAGSWSFPVLFDQGLSAYYSYGVVAAPSLALLDANGVIRYTRAGYSSSAREDIQEAVDELLELTEEKVARWVIKKRDYIPPKKATLHYQKAEALIRRGMPRRAAADLEKAAKEDPSWVEPRILLARIHWAEAPRRPGALEKAEEALREAHSIQPQNLRAISLLADVLVELGKHEEALALASQGLALEPSFTPALLAKARSLRSLKRTDEARAVLREASDLDPHNPHVFAEKGELAATNGDWEEAARLLRRSVELAIAASKGEG